MADGADPALRRFEVAPPDDARYAVLLTVFLLGHFRMGVYPAQVASIIRLIQRPR